MNASQVRDFCKRKLHLSAEPLQIPGCDIYTVAVEVTPKLAGDWLEKFNENNRNVRQAKVRQHAGDMQSGRWLLTHQGMAFDDAGNLTSGQHRLLAIVKSGQTVRFVIFVNCPQSERAVIDQASARNARDVASLAFGDEVSTLALAVCRTMKYGAAGRASIQMTPQETYAFFQDHRVAITYVLKFVPRQIHGVTSASVLGAISRAYYSMTREAIKDFVTVLVEGMPKSEADRPIILLRNWLLENRDALRNTHGRSRAYARTEAALFAYMEGETPARLSEPDKELFTIVGDAA